MSEGWRDGQTAGVVGLRRLRMTRGTNYGDEEGVL